MNTKDTPGPFDAFAKAEDGEPIFTLLGRDPLAGKTVRFWVGERRKAVLASNMPDDQEQAELTQITEAEGVSWDMDRYHQGLPPRGAIEVSKPRDSYSGAKLTEEVQAAVDLHEWRLKAARVLHNALAEANTVAEGLIKREIAGTAEATASVMAAVELLRFAADAVKPSRD